MTAGRRTVACFLIISVLALPPQGFRRRNISSLLPEHAEKNVPAWSSLQIASIGAHAPSQRCLARRLGILPDRKGSSAACVMLEGKMHTYVYRPLAHSHPSFPAPHLPLGLKPPPRGENLGCLMLLQLFRARY